MLTFRRPTEATVIRYLMELRNSPLTYDQLEVTRGKKAPDGFDFDVHQALLGYGKNDYETAKENIRQWAMFPKEMTTLYWPDRSIEVGADVAVLFRAGPLWSLNPCRIIYVFDEHDVRDNVHHFGFAYGTLDGHLECGEERFCVSWNRRDDSVNYTLTAVSRPNHFLTRVGYPYARIVQRRFRKLSARAILRAGETQILAAAV